MSRVCRRPSEASPGPVGGTCGSLREEGGRTARRAGRPRPAKRGADSAPLDSRPGPGGALLTLLPQDLNRGSSDPLLVLKKCPRPAEGQGVPGLLLRRRRPPQGDQAQRARAWVNVPIRGQVRVPIPSVAVLRARARQERAEHFARIHAASLRQPIPQHGQRAPGQAEPASAPTLTGSSTTTDAGGRRGPNQRSQQR